MALKCNLERSFRFLLPYVIIAAGIILFSRCSVSYSFTGASTEGLKTVSIQTFQNRASLVQPGLTRVITDALIDKCKAQTNLSIVTGPGEANFEGTIVDYNTKPLTVGADAQAATNRFTIRVHVKFTNSVKPENNFEQDFSRYEDYNSSLNLSAVEAELADKIIELLIEDIFNRAFVNW
jgi:hypothetical protein